MSASPSNFLRAYVLGIACWILAMILALKTGSAESAPEIIAQLRLPRALLATAAGIGLSVAGAALQAIFSNPLCEPYNLGISSGAALGTVLGISLELPWFFAGFAFSGLAGAMVFVGIIYLISRRPGVGTLALLLSGVMLQFLGASLVALWMALTDANGLQSAVIWLLGDLSRARLHSSLFALASVVLLAGSIWFRSRGLDALLFGEEDARSLGIDVARVRRRLMILVAVLVSVCVSAAGMIGFVGLIVPHFARRFVGALHFHLIPLCAIWGAAALVAADALARMVVRPYELPVGVVTALIGAPVFLWVILGMGRGRAEG